MAKDKTKPETAKQEQPQTRSEFMAKRREELQAAGELPPHQADTPAGYGEPIEQTTTAEKKKAAAAAANEAAAGEVAFEAWFQELATAFNAAGGDWFGMADNLRGSDEASLREAFAAGLSAEDCAKQEMGVAA